MLFVVVRARSRSGRSAQTPYRLPYGVDDLHVAATPTQVAREILADLLVARLGTFGQERLRRQQDPRRAIRALEARAREKRLLHDVEPPRFPEPLDGADVATIHQGGERETRADRP